MWRHVDVIARVVDGHDVYTAGDSCTKAALSALGGARDKAADHVEVVLNKMNTVEYVSYAMYALQTLA